MSGTVLGRHIRLDAGGHPAHLTKCEPVPFLPPHSSRLSTLYPLPQKQILGPGLLDELGDLGLGNRHRPLL